MTGETTAHAITMNEGTILMLVTLAAVFGAVLGWLYGKVAFELEEKEYQASAGLMAAALSVAVTVLFIQWLEIGIAGAMTTGVISALPGYFLAKAVNGALSRRNAPELYQKPRSWQTLDYVRNEDEGGMKAIGVFGGVIAGILTSGLAIGHYQTAPAVVLSILGPFLTVLPGMGAALLFMSMVDTVYLVGRRLFSRLNRLGERLAQGIINRQL